MECFRDGSVAADSEPLGVFDLRELAAVVGQEDDK
jgi:hypothetical protein